MWVSIGWFLSISLFVRLFWFLFDVVSTGGFFKCLKLHLGVIMAVVGTTTRPPNYRNYLNSTQEIEETSLPSLKITNIAPENQWFFQMSFPFGAFRPAYFRRLKS